VNPNSKELKGEKGVYTHLFIASQAYHLHGDNGYFIVNTRTED
jgi:hypothetical protein